MKVFTIDMGNSRTHCAFADGLKVSGMRDFDTLSFCETFDFSRIKFPVAWCSVVPKISLRLKKIFAQKGIENFCLNWKNSPIELDIKRPKQLGQDRIAVAVGASEFFSPPYIVVDMGTAVTIDLVDKNGKYAGGAIAPGLHAFVAYLNEKTAQLPKIDPRKADYNMALGKNTLEAMTVGCVKGFCRLADGLIGDMEKAYFDKKPAKARTVFTGGSVSLLPEKWLDGRLVEANLANIGLAKAFRICANLRRL